MLYFAVFKINAALVSINYNFLPSSQRGSLSVMCDEGTAALQWTSVARVAAQQVGYFENTVAGKITESWVAAFWATFIMYRGRPKCK